MDLVTLAPRASAEERAAVDSVLGPATTRWEGGDRTVPGDDRFARGGHEARARRPLLLPVLHAIQARVGWISRPALEYACRRLTIAPADAYGVATFYQMFSTVSRPGFGTGAGSVETTLGQLSSTVMCSPEASTNSETSSALARACSLKG